MNEKEIRDLLEKAHQSITAAKTLLKDEFYDFSASRSYYAMFYSVEALFLSQNRSFSKHKAVISAFGKEFIKTGIFPTVYHRYILDAFDLRNLGDYGTLHSVTKDQAEELIRNARGVVNAIQAYLTQKP